ncbi:MAG TPA: ketoacyl-ACP synthase III [Myxococcota bacterium]|nr:ketoacyl-ACP synthase III [Myxococcota bacterium]
MHDVHITGLGGYLPAVMHTNDTLPPLDAPLADGEDVRIGVRRRGWASEAAGESIPEMAAAAARQALARAGIAPGELDLVLLANWTQRRFIPEHAPRLQALLGAGRAFAFDLCTACAGFVYGVAVAHAFLQNPRFSRALVVASETTSRRGRPGSKSTLIFGDGAGAAVVERGAAGGARVLDYELATDGAHHGAMEIDEHGWVRTHLPQKELNALAARSFAEPAARLLARAGRTMDDVDWVVPHSGTAGIQATLIRALAVPAEKVLSNFATIGNVSSAAIPLALDEFVAAGRIRPGDTVLSPTTGTGWYAAALLLEMGEMRVAGDAPARPPAAAQGAGKRGPARAAPGEGR